MSKCICPADLVSLSQLCESCQAEYLNYQREREAEAHAPAPSNPGPEGGQLRCPEAGQPATLEDIQQMTNWCIDTFEHAHDAISYLMTRVEALEAAAAKAAA